MEIGGEIERKPSTLLQKKKKKKKKMCGNF